MALINLGPRDIEAVLAVARAGSFSVAARDLGLSQPAVSMRVRHAEDVLGVKLFHRTTRRVVATEHCERLVHHADQAMSGLRSLAQEFKEESRLKRGRIVVGVTPSIAGSLLPMAIQRFHKRWPDVEVVFQDEFLSRGLVGVHKGDFDLFVTPEIPPDSRFECEALMREEFFLVAPKDHSLVRSRNVQLADVARHPLVSMPAGTRTRELLAAAYREAGLQFRVAFETRQMLTLVAMVKAGLGIAFLSEHVLALCNLEGLKTARLVDVPLTRTISIVRAHGRAVQPPAARLIETIRQTLRSARA